MPRPKSGDKHTLKVLLFSQCGYTKINNPRLLILKSSVITKISLFISMRNVSLKKERVSLRNFYLFYKLTRVLDAMKEEPNSTLNIQRFQISSLRLEKSLSRTKSQEELISTTTFADTLRIALSQSTIQRTLKD